MKILQPFALSFCLLALCVLNASADPVLRFEVYADSTLAGQPGYLMHIDEPGAVRETLFLYEEAGRVRVLASREDLQQDWQYYAPDTYLAPAVGEGVGTSWAFIPDTDYGLLTATLESFETRNVVAGPFSTATFITRANSAPEFDLEILSVAAGVGLVYEFYFDEVPIELGNYFLAGGTGYFPLAAGNWWEYVLPGTPAPDTPAVINLLHANVPNPFNPATDIPYELAAAGAVRLSVYDAAGHLVRVLVDEPRAAGRHVAQWNGRDESGQTVAAGVYFCRFVVGSSQQSRAMTLVR